MEHYVVPIYRAVPKTSVSYVVGACQVYAKHQNSDSLKRRQGRLFIQEIPTFLTSFGR